MTETDTSAVLPTAQVEIKDIMVDIETLGSKAGCPVLAISAIRFNRAALAGTEIDLTQSLTLNENDYISSFHSPVSLLDCLAVGCTISAGTAQWWKKQSDRQILIDSMACTEPLSDTLIRLKGFIEGGYKSIWAKSPTFDLEILKWLAEQVDVDLGIDFRQQDDVRTETRDYPNQDVRALAKRCTVYDAKGNKVGAHNPVCDSVMQIRMVQEVYAQKFKPQ